MTGEIWASIALEKRVAMPLRKTIRKTGRKYDHPPSRSVCRPALQFVLYATPAGMLHVPL